MSDPHVREAISMNAAKIVNTVLAWETIIDRWTEILLPEATLNNQYLNFSFLGF